VSDGQELDAAVATDSVALDWALLGISGTVMVKLLLRASSTLSCASIEVAFAGLAEFCEVTEP